MGLIFTKTCVLCCKTLDADAGKAAMLCPACAKAVRDQYRCTERFQIDGADDAAAPLLYTGAARRSEERRVGKECLFRCRSRWSPYH